MPDLFIAPDETHSNTPIMHKRIPLPSSDKSSPIPTQSKNPPTSLLEHAGKDTVANKNTIPLFTSFWQNPTGIFFDSQETNEHILLFLRRHPITNVSWICITILLALLPPGAWYVAGLLNRTMLFGSLGFTTGLVIFYYLLIFTHAFISFLDWYYNVTLITEKRVIDIELNNLVGKKISATKVSLVQDVNYQQAGTLRSLFDYGDVLIQTASAVDNFFVNAVPKPEIVVRVMEDIIGESESHV